MDKLERYSIEEAGAYCDMVGGDPFWVIDDNCAKLEADLEAMTKEWVKETKLKCSVAFDNELLEAERDEANTFLDAAVIARDKFGSRICELEEERDELREAVSHALFYLEHGEIASREEEGMCFTSVVNELRRLINKDGE